MKVQITCDFWIDSEDDSKEGIIASVKAVLEVAEESTNCEFDDVEVIVLDGEGEGE